MTINHTMFKGSSAVLMAALLAGCSLAPSYQQPEAPVQARWSAAQGQGQESAPQERAQFIVDETLRELVELALNNNRSLRQSALDVEAARAQYRITSSSRLPHVNARGEGTRQRVPETLSPSGSSTVESSYQVGLGLTAFELDLFGRVRNLSESALQEFLASEEAVRSVQIGMVAEVSRVYLSLRAAAQALEIAEQTLENRTESMNLLTLRRDNGSASELEYQEALSLLEGARVERERSLRTLVQSRNALELLIAAPLPEDLEQRAVREGGFFRDIEPGLPSQLLEQRPDILAAEHRLRARHADIGAARAAFFPSISLTGFFGSASNELSGLFEGGSRAWQFMPQINVPLFNAGSLRSSLELARIRQEQAVAAYELAVQTAFTEVADALAGRETLMRQAQAQEALDTSNSRALALSEMRYEGGVDSFPQYLDVQRRVFADRLALVEAQRELELANLSLYVALGGGWR